MSAAASLLVLGGARSGKSSFAQSQAERRAARDGLARVFVATAQALDDEMTARIAAHRAARGSDWEIVEAPCDLAKALRETATAGRIVLVDCLTLWLSNIMLRGDDAEAAGAGLEATVGQLAGPAIFVSNEVGSGIVPDTALGRAFRDAQGRLNQRMAGACGKVVLVTAGLPMVLKPYAAAAADFT